MENNNENKLFSLTKSLNRTTVSYFYDKPPSNRTKFNRINFNFTKEIYKEEEIKRWNKCEILNLEEDDEIKEIKIIKKLKLEELIIDPLMILEANSIFNIQQQQQQQQLEEEKKLKDEKENKIKKQQKEEHFIPTGPSTSRLQSTLGSSTSKPIPKSRIPIILEAKSSSSFLPKGRNGGGDRNHLLKSLNKRDYEPYLSNEMVELEWYKPYMTHQIKFLLTIEPETLLWSLKNSSIFSPTKSYNQDFPLLNEILSRGPNKLILLNLLPSERLREETKNQVEEGMLSGAWNIWESYRISSEWCFNKEGLNWREIRWIVEEAPLPVAGIVKAFAEFLRYRYGVLRGWSELYSYLATIHTIKLRPRLHRALNLLDYLLAENDPLLSQKRMEKFFVDGGKKLGRCSEFLVESELINWKIYLDGGDENLIERMMMEETKELEERRNCAMMVGN